MRTSDDGTLQTSPFKQPGMGLPYVWRCMGCNKNRGQQGMRGVGPRKRCAECVARRNT